MKALCDRFAANVELPRSDAGGPQISVFYGELIQSFQGLVMNVDAVTTGCLKASRERCTIPRLSVLICCCVMYV